MSSDPNSGEPIEHSETKSNVETHRVTAHEAHWNKYSLAYDDSEQTVDVSFLGTTETVDGSIFHWEYFCSCGAEFNDIDEAKAHLQQEASSV